jgi:hypothetical protein
MSRTKIVSLALSIIGLEPMTQNLQSGNVWAAESSPAMESGWECNKCGDEKRERKLKRGLLTSWQVPQPSVKNNK